MCSAAVCCLPPAGATSTERACGAAWRSPAACSSRRSSQSAGNGAGAGPVRRTTSISPSAVAEGFAGALERPAALAPLVLAARVVADVPVPLCLQSLAGHDRVVAVRVRAVDDDLRVQVWDALRQSARVEGGGRNVDRARQMRVCVDHGRESVDENELVAALELVLQLVRADYAGSQLSSNSASSSGGKPAYGFSPALPSAPLRLSTSTPAP